jgi:phospholipid transport system transporter-binding protein
MLVLPSELTHSQANACLQMLVQGLKSQSGSAVVVDGAGLQRFDSSALAVLLELRRECLGHGRSLSISAMPARLRDLAGLYGIGELLPAV